MDISNLYDYLHFKQNLIRRILPRAHKDNKRSLRSMLKKYEHLEASLDTLCEETYYFNCLPKM